MRVKLQLFHVLFLLVLAVFYANASVQYNFNNQYDEEGTGVKQSTTVSQQIVSSEPQAKPSSFVSSNTPVALNAPLQNIQEPLLRSRDSLFDEIESAYQTVTLYKSGSTKKKKDAAKKKEEKLRKKIKEQIKGAKKKTKSIVSKITDLITESDKDQVEEDQVEADKKTTQAKQNWSKYGMKKGAIPLITVLAIVAGTSVLCCCCGATTVGILFCYLKFRKKY